ncbi:MAG TPA: response regulator [Steroidobacteraceae bacterium]|nr:response regulator [Steroidobacteraceae bacterium]
MRLDPEDPRASTKPRILFVEDEPMLREHLAEALSEEYCVDTAGTGKEALTVVLRAKPDLVVTDIVMPEMDGVELLKTLRSVPSTQAIPVLLLSGRAPEEQRVEGFRSGADGYLAKPYSERELRALIGSMIQSAHHRAEAVRREAIADAERRALADRAALLESITDAFFALDRDWRFTYVNQRALDYYGKRRDELLGRSIWDVFPVAAGTMLHEQYEKALRTQCSAAFETKSVLTDRWVDIRAYPTGQGLAVHFRDVSDRKLAEQELQAALTKLEGREWRLNLATHAAGLAVFSWDSRSDRIMFESEPPPEILRLAQETLLTGARFLQQLVHSDDRRVLRRQLIRCLRSAELLRGVCRIPGVEESWRWIEINGGCERPHGHGMVRLVGVVRDVTGRRQIEDTLRESDRRKDEFLALLSHELRNPLAPIANGLSLLKLRGAADPEPVSQRALGIMERQLSHLVRLVDDLLDVGRMTHGKLRLRIQRVSLLDILGRALEGARTALESRGHTLTTDVRAHDLMLEGDADRLIQVFTNLIQNSVKYTDAGGRIRIELDREYDEAVVSVTDNGVGIPPHALEQVFEMFSQVKLQQPRAGGGLGIGLALVRAIVQMHGGTIRAASAGPGLGSTFTVRLPLASGEVSRPEADPQNATGVTAAARGVPCREGPRIMVVDDNVDAAASLADLLQLKGYPVLTAATGEEALEQARSFRPHVIFMDIGLPGIDGVETSLRIHAMPELQDVTVVAVTGWGQPSDRARTRAAGIVAHLLKPVAPEALEHFLAAFSPGVAQPLPLQGR